MENQQENQENQAKQGGNKKKEFWRFVKFALISASAAIIDGGSFALLDAITPWEYDPKQIISVVLSVLWNFTFNRKFTFKSANNVPVAMLKVAAFYAVFTPLSALLGVYLTGTLGWNGLLVKAINMLLNFVLEYVYDRFVVFGKSIDTAKKDKKDARNEEEETKTSQE